MSTSSLIEGNTSPTMQVNPLRPENVPVVPQECLAQDAMPNTPAEHTQTQATHIDEWQGQTRSTLRLYLGLIALLIVFVIVYEYFSHGVMTPFMWGSPAVPLLVGFLPTLLFNRFVGRAHSTMPLPNRTVRNCWHGGVASLTVACAFKGVIIIFGTESTYTQVLFIVAAVQFVLAIALYAVQFAKKRANAPLRHTGTFQKNE